MTTRSQSRPIVCALTILVAALAGSQDVTRAQDNPQLTRPQAAMVTDLGNLSDKFVGLARVMAGKYDWRPGQGVRSVSEVFNLIVTENNMLAGLIATGKGSMAGGAAITDPAALQAALTSSYASVSKALADVSASDLNASVTLFGQNTTRQGAVLMLLLDQHEHLGQSIAYARSNSVVPPWSK